MIIRSDMYTTSTTSGRSRLVIYSCEETERCELFDSGKCEHLGRIKNCIYGNASTQTTQTMRARKYYNQLGDLKKQHNKIENLVEGYPRKCMARVGDYVYLPYDYMNNEYGDMIIPFKLRHLPFIHIDDFTIQTIGAILKLRPQALFGGYIRQYVDESIPLFVFHLKAKFPELYEKYRGGNEGDNKGIDAIYNGVIKRADLSKVPIRCIPPGVTEGYRVGYKKEEYKLEIHSWDGESLCVSGNAKFDLTWVFDELRQVSNSTVTVTCKPDLEKTLVEVVSRELTIDIIDKYPEVISLGK